MITIRHVLCPTDFSEFSARALAYARALATWYGSSITSVHVYPFIPPPPSEVQGYGRQVVLEAGLRERLLREMRRELEPAKDAGLPTEAVLLEGDPVREIVRCAREKLTDLMVLGTHGRGGFERLFLGSVTEKVLRKAPCPVLTVPQHADRVAGRAAPVFRHILCPVDFSEPSLRALEYAFALAKEANAAITLFHSTEAMAEPGTPESLTFNVPEFRRELETQARARLEGLVPAGAADWCRPAVMVTSGKAWRDILALADERQADLVVMGVVGRGALDLMLFGSTTHHVVRQATCPVLTVLRRPA